MKEPGAGRESRLRSVTGCSRNVAFGPELARIHSARQRQEVSRGQGHPEVAMNARGVVSAVRREEGFLVLLVHPQPLPGSVGRAQSLMMPRATVRLRAAGPLDTQHGCLLPSQV